MIKFLNFVAKEVFLRLNQGQRRKEVSGSMEKAPKKYSSLKEVSLATLSKGTVWNLKMKAQHANRIVNITHYGHQI